MLLREVRRAEETQRHNKCLCQKRLSCLSQIDPKRGFCFCLFVERESSPWSFFENVEIFLQGIGIWAQVFFFFSFLINRFLPWTSERGKQAERDTCICRKKHYISFQLSSQFYTNLKYLQSKRLLVELCIHHRMNKLPQGQRACSWEKRKNTFKNDLLWGAASFLSAVS